MESTFQLLNSKKCTVTSDELHSFVVGGRGLAGSRGPDADGLLPIFRYSARSCHWKHIKANCPVITSDGAAAIVDEQLIIACGKTRDGEVSSEIWKVPLSGWDKNSQVNAVVSSATIAPLAKHAACSNGDDLVFVHGGLCEGQSFGGLYIYSASRDQVKGPLAAPPCTNHSMCYAKDKIYVLDSAQSCVWWSSLKDLKVYEEEGEEGYHGWHKIPVSSLPSAKHCRIYAWKDTVKLFVLETNRFCDMALPAEKEDEGEGKDQEEVLLTFKDIHSSTGQCQTNVKPDYFVRCSDGIWLICTGSHLYSLGPDGALDRVENVQFSQDVLKPVPPSPTKVTTAPSPHASNSSRLLLRVVPEDKEVRRCTVKARKQHQQQANSNLAATEAPVPRTVHIDAVHPHESCVAIQSNAVPVDVRLFSKYETSADETIIKLEWIDMQRLISVQLEQHVYLSLAKKEKYEAQVEQLEDERRQLQDEWRRIDERRAELDEREQFLNTRNDELHEYEEKLEAVKEKLEERSKDLKAEHDGLDRDRNDFQQAVKRREELERENEKKLRQERENHKKIERDLEGSRKKDEKLREQLQRAIDAQHNTERQLQREFERIEREREQHKREVEWRKEKDEVHAQEKAQYERKIAQLKNDIKEKEKQNEVTTYEVKEARLLCDGLQKDCQQLTKTLDDYEGRKWDEIDAVWSKRKDNFRRNMDQCNKGKYSTVGFSMDINAGTNVTCIVEGGKQECALYPAVSVSSSDTAASGGVHLEIGDGFTFGDVLFHSECVLDDATTVIGLKNKQPVATRISTPKTQMLQFEFISGCEVKAAVEAILRGVCFSVHSTKDAYKGVRSIEITVSIDGKKHQSFCTGTSFVAVIPSPLSVYRDPQPYVERAPPIPIFSHVSVINPFADRAIAKTADSCSVAFLQHGLNGPMGAPSSAKPDAKSASYFAQNKSGLVALRRGWKNLPSQVDEKGIFSHGVVKVRLVEKIQEEDTLVYEPKEEDATAIANTVEVSVADNVITIKVVDPNCTKQQLFAALNSITFSSNVIPLDAVDRAVSYDVNFPNFKLPLEYTATRPVTIVNSAHEVNVTAPTKSRPYRYHSSTVTGVDIKPPHLWLFADIVVDDPLKSRFSGKVGVTINNATTKDKDALGVLLFPSSGIVIEAVPAPEGKEGEAADENQYYRVLDSASNVEFGKIEILNQNTAMRLVFNVKTTSKLAQDTLRSIVFSSLSEVADSSKTVVLDAELGRGNRCKETVTILTSPPLVHVAKLGGLKWTEHQGPILSTWQCLPCKTHGSLQPFTMRVMIFDGLEEGDLMGVEGGEEVTKPESLIVLGVDLAEEVVKSELVRSLEPPTPFHYLKDGSLIVDFDDSNMSALNGALAIMNYVHTTLNPTNLKKIFCVRTVDRHGAWSDALLPLAIVPVDDPTEIDNLPRKTLYFQGSKYSNDGFSLASTAVLFDPDTEDFVGGHLSIEPFGTFSSRDAMSFLPLAVQAERNAKFLVHVDESMRVHAFPSMEAYEEYEASVSLNILNREDKDSLKYCVGYLQVTESLEVNIEPEIVNKKLMGSQSVGSFNAKPTQSSFFVPAALVGTIAKWEVHFSPETPKLIPLDKVEAVLRAFAFQNTSPHLSGDREFVIRLGAGTLAPGANVDGAELADETVAHMSLITVPFLLFTPNFSTELTIPAGVSGSHNPFKNVTAQAWHSKYFKLANAKLVAKIVNPLEDEGVSLQLKKGAGEVPIELQGTTLINLSTSNKATIGNIKASRTTLEIELASVDAKTLQSLVRCIAYERITSATAKLTIPRQLQVSIENCIAEQAEEEYEVTDNDEEEEEEGEKSKEEAATAAEEEEARSTVESKEEPLAAAAEEAGVEKKQHEEQEEGTAAAAEDGKEKDEEAPKEETKASPEEQNPLEADEEKTTEADKEKKEEQEQEGAGEEEKARKKTKTVKERPFVPPFSFPTLCANITVEGKTEPESHLKCTTDNVEHVLRSGSTFVLSNVYLSTTSTLLRNETCMIVSLPTAAGQHLSLEEDLQLTLRPLTSEEESSLVVRGMGQPASQEATSSPRKEKAQPPQTIVYNGKPIAILSLTSNPKGYHHRVQCICCPPDALREILRRFSYNTSAKDKPGVKHVVKIKTVHQEQTEEISLNINIRPSFVDELPKSFSVAYHGPPVNPLSSIKVRPPSEGGFVGGRITMDIYASNPFAEENPDGTMAGSVLSGSAGGEGEGEEGRAASPTIPVLPQKLSPFDRIDFVDSDTDGVFIRKLVQESAQLVVKSPSGTGEIVVGNAVQTRTSIVIDLVSDNSIKDALQGDLVQTILRNCVFVEQNPELRSGPNSGVGTPQGRGLSILAESAGGEPSQPAYDLDVRFNLELKLSDAKGTTCGCILPITGTPLDKKKSKILKKK